MFIRKIRSLIKLGVLICLLIAACILLAHSLVQRPSVQKYLLARLSETLGYDIKTGEISLSLWGRVGIHATDFSARSAMGSAQVDISSLTVFVDPLELFRGRIVPTRVSLFKPKIELDPGSAYPSGVSTSKVWSLDFFHSLAAFPSFSVSEATLRVKDFPYSLSGLSFDVFKRIVESGETRLLIVFNGRIANHGQQAHVKGRLGLVRSGENGTAADMTLEIGDFPLNWVPFPEEIVVNAGRVQANLKFNGFIGGLVHGEGDFVLRETSFDLVDEKRTKMYVLPEIAIAFKSSFSKGILKIPSFDFETGEFTLNAESQLDLNNTSNPTLSLKVWSPFLPTETFKKIVPTPLLPKWLEERIFGSLKEGQVKLEHFTLNGTVDDIENLDTPENRGILSTALLWKGLDVSMAGGSLPIQGVSGNLVVEEGRLIVSEVTGTFGLSEVKASSLQVDDLYADVSSYLISIEGAFYLQDLLKQRGIPVIPRDVRRILGRIEPINGKMIGSIGIVYHDDWDYPRLGSADMKFENFVITQHSLVWPLTLEELHFRAGKGQRNTFQAEGLWGNTQFSASGSSIEGWEDGEARVEALADLAQLNTFFQGDGSRYQFGGQVACDLSLSWSGRLISCLGEMDLSRVVVETPNICIEPSTHQRRIIFDAELEAMKRIHIREGAWYLGDSILEFSGNYDREHNRIKNLSFSTEGLALQDLGIRFKDADIKANGSLIGHGTIKDFSPESRAISITGMVRGNGLSFVAPGLASPITDSRFRLEFSERKATIHSMYFRMGNSQVSVRGELEGGDGLKGYLNADAAYLDLADFIQKEDVEGGEDGDFLSEYLERSNIVLGLNIQSGLWRKLKLKNSEAEMQISDGDLFIKRSNIALEHGFADVEGFIKTKEGLGDYLSINFRLVDQPVNELLESLPFAEGSIEGTASLHGSISMRGRNPDEMVYGMDGHANLRIERGKIIRSNILIKILQFLSLQKIFIRIPKDLSKEGFYFDSLECNLNIEKGAVKTQDLFMRSPVINMAGRGMVDVPNEKVDFDLAVQPLGTIDTLLKYIPVVGHILKGEEESILVYYFKVSGSLDEQETNYLPLKNLGSSFLGFFKRLFLAPKGIVDGVTDTIK